MTTRELHALLGSRWALPILTALTGPALRFCDLKRAVPGVSQRMLALALRRLLAAGLVAHQGDLYGLEARGDSVLRWSALPAFDWLVAS